MAARKQILIALHKSHGEEGMDVQWRQLRRYGNSRGGRGQDSSGRMAEEGRSPESRFRRMFTN